MIRQLLISIAMAAVSFCTPVLADDGKRLSGVVELFTSQGCNSCPPADQVLADLANEGNVIALGYHVDYWDYLGWKDTLGSPEYTARQHGYAKTFTSRSVYTPQAVVNGRLHVNGADRRTIDGNLGKLAAANQGLSVDISVEQSGNRVVIRADEGGGELGDAHIVLVYFDRTRDVEIQRGENRGKTITYANIVTGIQTAGMWHGEAVQLEMPKSEIDKRGNGGCAVLLQAVSKDGSPGAIIGAALLEHS